MINPVSTSTVKQSDSDRGSMSKRPCILITGLRRSGKTSIQQVIFNKMQPSQTQFLESTARLTTNHYSCGSFINFQVQEVPGQLHASLPVNSMHPGANHSNQKTDENNLWTSNNYDIERLLKNSHAIVYIIDAQDEYIESIQRLILIIQTGRRVNPKLRYEIFIHKVDQLSEETKADTQRDIHNQVRDRYSDSTGNLDAWPSVGTSNSQDILINFHLTSIYDHSIFEAFSKVIQKLLPQFAQLEYLLDYLTSASNIEHAFLFDVQTKISIATDSSPVDIQMYELCCDMIDLLLSMSEIYGQPNVHTSNQNTNSDDEDEDPSIDYNNVDDEYSSSNNNNNTSHEFNSTQEGDDSLLRIETNDEPASSVFDSMSSSVIKLTGGRALFLKEVNRHLALICVLREEALNRQAIIDYNVRQLKESILRLLRIDQQNSLQNENLSAIHR